MSEDEILSELRTIRTLLALDKGDELKDIISDLDQIQHDALDEIGETWTSVATDEIAEAHGVSVRTVQRRIGVIKSKNLIEQKGSRSGAEYRATGLLKAARLVATE